MNRHKCPHSVWWLAFIAGAPILALAYVLYLLNLPVDPWAAGAHWGAVIAFYGAPGVLIPLVCGVLTYFRVWRRKEAVSRCLLLAMLPSVCILTASLIFFFNNAMQLVRLESRSWQSKAYALPTEEREPIQQYLTIQELALTWVDASDERLNHRLVRLSANAEACLRQKLPNLQAERIQELNQWVHVGETNAADEKVQTRWQRLLNQYPSDYQQYRTHCDETLNFNTVETRYPNG